jgi:hypothetical protein
MPAFAGMTLKSDAVALNNDENRRQEALTDEIFY